MAATSPGPAGRFLHVCYCCADAGAATDRFVEGLGLRNTMRTPPGKSNGELLGLNREMESVASFVFDVRGPRISPAIEVQGWITPPVEGPPMSEPHHVGAQALGFAVPSLDAAVTKLEELGHALVGRTEESVFGGRAAVMRDPDGVTVDLVEASLPSDEPSRMHHLRVTCSDLQASLDWYAVLGFVVVDELTDVTDAQIFGIDDAVRYHATRLRLPEEAFELVLTEWSDPASHGRHYSAPNHAGWYRAAVRVDDTRASYEALSAAGVAFDRAPMLVELKGTPVPDMWITFLSDPDGVPFEFVERPRSAFR